jgi:hypothetical protein
MRTNLSNKSLISADRTNKGTLPLTILRCIFKSSAKDFTSPIFEIIIRRKIRSLSATHPLQHNMIQDSKVYSYSTKHGENKLSLPAWILT